MQSRPPDGRNNVVLKSFSVVQLRFEGDSLQSDVSFMYLRQGRTLLPLMPHLTLQIQISSAVLCSFAATRHPHIHTAPGVISPVQSNALDMFDQCCNYTAPAAHKKVQRVINPLIRARRSPRSLFQEAVNLLGAAPYLPITTTHRLTSTQIPVPNQWFSPNDLSIDSCAA